MTNSAVTDSDQNVAPTNQDAMTSVTANADLSFTSVTSAPASPSPGQDVTFTITVINNGPSAATTVVVTEDNPLPTNLTFKSGSGVGGPCVAGPPVSCPAGDLLSGASAVVTLVLTVGGAAPVGTITNNVHVASAVADADLSDNVHAANVSVGAASADLGVTLSVNPTSASPGDKVTYSISLQNVSSSTDATNVTVTDTLPAGLTPVTPPATPTTGTAAVVGNVWTWTLPTVAKSSTVTATFDATVDAGTPDGTITDTVGITKADQTDPVTTNNTASADLTVGAGVADLTLTTAVDNSKPSQGDTIKIAIQVANAGPDDATNVVLKDVLPNGLKYKSCSGCQTGVRRATSQTISWPTIPAGSVGVIALNVVVQASSGTLKNTASVVSSDQSDPNGADNKDSLTITVGGASNNPGAGNGGGGSGSSGSGSGTSGSGGTAFTGFTAAQLMPWFLLLFSIGLAAVELSRRRALVSPIGFTYGFDRPF